MLKKGSRLNDTTIEVLYFTENEKAKVTSYHLRSTKYRKNTA
jgi:hypothetical protein